MLGRGIVPHGIHAAILSFFFMLGMLGQPVLGLTFPVTTKYYSLDLPKDWAVLRGPIKQDETLFVQLANTKKTTTATLVVAKASPKTLNEAIKIYSKRLQTTPITRQGQTEFKIKHKSDVGYCLLRYEPRSHLLVILSVSGELKNIDFLFKVRTPYVGLFPLRPLDLDKP